MWIAKKQQQIKRDGRYVTVKPGDPIPEAATWPNTKTWVDGGFIKWVDREDKPVKKPVEVKKAAPVETPSVTIGETTFELEPAPKKKKKTKKRLFTKDEE